ncbi:hypothetical protein L1987_25576 [Smallanthus sonchifolius]|uniref:Uncharacterized protein n=1 Tax=Smallanthus sonchifolius TaxID=185202 RepID=A0ACB9I7I2_9ASTR|nr:hypothetical protein L1987_25576 [Smallanthus sonchifolius]
MAVVKVSAEVVYTEKDSIQKGIVELILEHDVRRLVMGAAADRHYSRRMVDLRSKKAIYVRLQAPPSCQIHFLCKGNIVFTRQGRLNGPRVSISPMPLPPNTNFDYGQNSLSEGSEVESDNGAVPGFKQIIQTPSPSSVIERGINDELYDQLVQVMAEADNSKRDAFEEFSRCMKAEKDAIEAKCKVKASENLYAEELRKRREINEALEKTKEEDENIKKELDEVVEELRMALEQKSFLESQIADFDHTVQDLEQKLFSAVDLLQNYKMERDELQVECDEVLRLLGEMKAEDASCSSVSQSYTEFSFSEVKDATRNFDQSLKIGEGGYGSIFRGFIRHTQVAIKMLHSHSLQGPTEFQQEVNVLSKLRHPNLVTLIGACPDAWIIIYEYLSGGSLEDRLNCKDNTPPLSWQNRIRIAAQLCSALISLHSCGIVHGDLKPANLLLDNNLVTKLSDFGICRVLSQNEFSSNSTSLCCQTDLKGTFVYMDLQFLCTGELTPKSDTYSFGIILLRLLTGRPASGLLTKEVQRALNEERLKSILDPTAGDWPFVQAQQLALLAMNCCDVVRKKRPDLASEAWRVLEPMWEMMQDPVVAADGFTYEAEALRGWLDS